MKHLVLRPSRRRALQLFVCVLVIGPLALLAQTREDAVRLRSKVDAITRHAESGARTPLVTRVTEQEVNAFFAYDGRQDVPQGITDPRIAILGDGRVSGTAVIDLDAVREQRKSRGFFDPLNYLAGRLAISVAGVVDAADGLARFDLESARIGGVPIPRAVVAELVAYYSRTPANPQGLNLDDPFPLPARIRRIDVRRGEAIVVQ